ncbi:MAG: Fe(3+) ABC transporter substrate-binding protein [Oculatellaceae cyanobacterium Prado106]|jgi:iron(III) transport system substrate-binding protein|nr:Fe(3+) ABC transporter substrate-binding protein [Oculatellaceae cyanobacterium Prado106]
MNKIARRQFIGMGAAAAAIATAQFGKSAKAQTSPGGVVNLYSSRHYDTDNALYESFTRATGIRVNLIEAEADPLIERIKTEGANSPADVLITVDAGRLWRAEQEGLFQPIESSVLTSAVPANLRHPDGLWYGFSKRARVIMYDKSKVNPAEITTYEALTDPKWRGQILTRSSTNIYSVSLTSSVLEANGSATTEEWIQGLVANLARQPEGNDTAQIQACAAGVGSLAIANTYYLVRMMKSDKPEERAIAEKLGVVFPNQRDRGTHVNISGGGVLKNSPNKAAAIKFLEHMVSPEAQEIFAKGNNEYPVIANAPVDPMLQALGNFKEDPVSATVYGRNSLVSLQLMNQGGWA